MTTYIDVALSTIPWVVVLWDRTSRQPASPCCTHPEKEMAEGACDCDSGSHRAEDDAFYGGL